MSDARNLSVDGTDWTECGGPRGYWWLPALLLGTLVAVGLAILALRWVGAVPAHEGGPFPPPIWVVFPLGFLLFWLAIAIWVRPWGWGARGRWNRAGTSTYGPEDLVRMRFAGGEISKDQMSRMLRDLEETGPMGRGVARPLAPSN